MSDHAATPVARYVIRAEQERDELKRMLAEMEAERLAMRIDLVNTMGEAYWSLAWCVVPDMATPAAFEGIRAAIVEIRTRKAAWEAEALEAKGRLAEQRALVEAAVALVKAEVAEHAAADDLDAACRVEDAAMTYAEWRPARDRLNATTASLEAARTTRKDKQESLLVEARAYAARQAEPGGSGEGQP